MGFIGDLGSAISSQFNLSQNTTNTLSAVVDGQQQQYGSLGSFASEFDQSAERRYLEEGYLRVDPFETDPKQLEILWQQPSATVLIRKKMFSSVAENYRTDYMDMDEKLYYKAMNVLFQNKCSQIAALEQLSKIQQVTSAVGNISLQLVPVITTLADIINNGYSSGLSGLAGISSSSILNPDIANFLKVSDRLRILYANQTAQYTTWIPDPLSLYQSTLANGTGVIEITNFTKFDTNCGVDLNSKSGFSLSISDPYESMLITDYDIELALSDATNAFYNNKSFQFGAANSQQIITNQQNNLNTTRNNRNASSITFNIDPNSIFGQKVTAIIDRLGIEIPFTYDTGFLGLGGSVTVPAEYLRGGDIAGYDGLDTGSAPIGQDNNIRSLTGNSELSNFQTIITTIFAQLQLMSNAANNTVSNNQFTNYARRKLRFNFSGKLIIQPMDAVNIYINSKSQTDNKILAGLQQLFTGVGILQSITNTVSSISTLLNPAANVAFVAEKTAYVGANFPNSLWGMVRSQFVTEIEGTHVFAGLVKTANDNWSNGQFNINISGQDNTYYLEQGKINFNPGADAFNGLYFDPLTPFVSKFDAVTTNSSSSSSGLEFLDENKYILSDTPSGSLIKYKLGSMVGLKATTSNWQQGSALNKITGRQTQTFCAPDGLVYKWKQGISIFTQTGSNSNINDASLVGNPNIYKEPFAGLDVMNVISLLITGIPYNYQTYFKTTTDVFGFEGDPQSGLSSSNTYMSALTASLTKNNALWGNFIPFKSPIINEAAMSQFMQLQLSISNANTDLDSKLRKFADLQNNLVALGAVNALSTNIQSSNNPTIAAQFNILKAQVSNLQGSINSSISDIKSQTTNLFSQVISASSIYTNSFPISDNDPVTRDQLRKQLNTTTRRMSYNVRSNADKNFFIVDDYYDSDYDIATFNQALSDGISLYSYDFTSVLEKLGQASSILDIEVFCDTQGHIRARPPQYNKMPSSVFNRMLYLKQTTGIQIFPQFLNNLFTNQVDTLRQNIEVIEDEIRLQCAILGNYPSLDANGDNTAQAFITNSNVGAGMSGVFNFLSDSTDVIVDASSLILAANPTPQVNGEVLNAYNTIVSAGTSTKQLFSNNSAKAYILFQALQAQVQSINSGINVNSSPSVDVFSQGSVAQQLITRITTKSGQSINSQDFLTSAGPNQPTVVSGQTIDLFKVTQNLTDYIQQWQSAVKTFYHTIKNASEFIALDAGPSTSNSITISFAPPTTPVIPGIYAHMIEDETFDDYGPGSGNRYIIHNYQIRSLNISENPPPFTSVEIQGTLAPNMEANQGGIDLESFPGGGNSLVTALAVDYDMWRNYGFKNGSPIKVPFLQDPDTQCGPFAAVVLSRNRANILQGTCVISGNEYMQPGEVIFLEGRNLLFYVNKVSHNYTEGKDFTTTLDLKYGHPIGEYIPSYFDSIGKMICKNQNTIDVIVHRQESSTSEQNLGIVQLDSQNTNAPITYSGPDSSSINRYSATNQTVINNILYKTSYAIQQNGAAGNNVTAAIELRVYCDEKHSPLAQSAANQVQSILTGGTLGQISSFTTNQPTPPQTINPSSAVKVVVVNMDDDKDHRSPSQQAMDAARNQIANASTNTGNSAPTLPANNNALRTALFSYIVDCWITFTPVTS